MHTFIAGIFASLLGVILFWGITYLIVIKRKRIKVRAWLAIPHILIVASILSIIFNPARKMTADENGIMAASSLLLSIISCLIFKFHESKNQRNKELKIENLTSASIQQANTKANGFFRLGVVLSGIFAAIVFTAAYDRMPRQEKIYKSWFFEAADTIASDISERDGRRISFLDVKERYLNKEPEANIKWLHQVAEIHPDYLGNPAMSG